VHLSGAGPLAVSYLVEQDACLQEVLFASFLVEVVPCASQEEGGRRLSLEEEGEEGASRPRQSSYGKAGDAMKESGR